MKYLLLIRFIFIAVLISACSDDPSGSKCIEGNGNVIKIDRKVTVFKRIILNGSGTLMFSQGFDYAIAIETDENLQNYINVINEGDSLNIELLGNASICPTELNIHIVCPDPAFIKIKGRGNIINNTPFIVKNFEAMIDGSGNINLNDFHPDTLNTSVRGSGNIILSGETQELLEKISGSGDINSLDMLAKSVRAEITGSGNISVFASKFLSAIIGGSGNIKYKGNPDSTSLNINGAGEIQKLD